LSIRLNKLLARRGLGARRKCDVLIQSGVVRVNGQVVKEPGTMVEPERDRIEVRNRPLPPAAEHRYFVLHKPIGVISTLHDPEGRRTIRDLLPPGPRLFPVGRLDADTSGLLVLTNDGELAHHLMHPRYGVAKSYRVRVAPVPSPAQLHRLGAGVEFEPGVVSAPARVWLVEPSPDRATISLVIHEGRYRQVRRMCEAVGLTVLGLHRSAYGPLHLGALTRGMWRELSADEVASLRAAAARPSHARAGRYLGVPRRAGAPRGPGLGPPAGEGRTPLRSARPARRALPARSARLVRPARPVRAGRPEGSLRAGGPARSRRPVDTPRRGAARGTGDLARPRALKRPRGPGRSVRPARPVDARRVGNARPRGPMRPRGPGRAAGPGRPTRSPDARPRRSTSPGRAGKMARPSGPGRAKSRSSRPPRGRGRPRGR